MWFRFLLNLVSGVLLLLCYPTKALTNPVFYVKLTLIAAAMGLYVVIRRRIFDVADVVDNRSLRFIAGTSLVCWAGAITAGRLLAYTYTRLFATW